MSRRMENEEESKGPMIMFFFYCFSFNNSQRFSPVCTQEHLRNNGIFILAIMNFHIWLPFCWSEANISDDIITANASSLFPFICMSFFLSLLQLYVASFCFCFKGRNGYWCRKWNRRAEFTSYKRLWERRVVITSPHSTAISNRAGAANIVIASKGSIQSSIET